MLKPLLDFGVLVRTPPRDRVGVKPKGRIEMNLTQTLMAAAVTGILAGTTACGGEATPPPAAPAAPAEPAAGEAAPATSAASDDRAPSSTELTDPAKHACKGQNSCKGRGGCKTELNTCKGQNACKSRGGCKTT